MGCNPGTKVKIKQPTKRTTVADSMHETPAPVLSTMRRAGGTEKHIKVARTLLDYGVDPIAPFKKRPLHFAVEHPYHKGDSKLTFFLL